MHTRAFIRRHVYGWSTTKKRREKWKKKTSLNRPTNPSANQPITVIVKSICFKHRRKQNQKIIRNTIVLGEKKNRQIIYTDSAF